METNIYKFEENFIENYDADSNKGYAFEANAEYPKNWHNLHSNLPSLLEKIKIKKCNKLVCNIYDKENCIVHIRALKQALNNRLILKKYI